jgi:phospholipid/cholesterol/gamma-HCH transport system ATP-binding protein
VTTIQPPLLEARNLVRRYGTRVVLGGISFRLERGDCLVILGRSGSGKSVLLRQLNGLERPDEGSVLFDGRDLAGLDEAGLAPIRKRMAMLFQSGALFDSLDVFENLAFPLREHTTLTDPEIAERVERRLALVQLSGIERKPPSALSGGMRKRVALARSLMLDPEVVLFDEPTTGLDPRTAATIGELIRRVQAEAGVTPVVVTHDLHLAALVADRAAFLDRGVFRFLGTWHEAKQCADEELRRFLAGEPDPPGADLDSEEEGFDVANHR